MGLEIRRLDIGKWLSPTIARQGFIGGAEITGSYWATPTYSLGEFEETVVPLGKTFEIDPGNKKRFKARALAPGHPGDKTRSRDDS